MSDTVGFAFLAGLAVGFIAGTAFIGSVIVKIDKNRIKRGFMEDEGVVYRITEVKP